MLVSPMLSERPGAVRTTVAIAAPGSTLLLMRRAITRLLPLVLAGHSGSFGGTDTFWFVMNLGQPEDDYGTLGDVAEDYAGPIVG